MKKMLDVEFTILASRNDSFKGTGVGKTYELMDDIPVHRLFNTTNEQFSYQSKYMEIFEIVSNLKPDIIFCAHQGNLPLAIKLRKDFEIPIALKIEFASKSEMLISKRKSFGINLLRYVEYKLYWLWLTKVSNAIISAYPGDITKLDKLSKNGTPIYHVPWCNQLPENIKKGSRDINSGIYVGSFSKFKNSNELLTTIPLILEKTPITTMTLVGPDFETGVVKKLKLKYPNQIKYVKSMSRIELLEEISKHYFSYTPVKTGGWGFIGDSWAVKTPLIMTHNDYNVQQNVEAIITAPDRIHNAINAILEDNNLYKKLQNGGEKRYNHFHSAKSTGDKYYKIFEKTINGYQK